MEKFDFEKSLSELQKTVSELEKGDMTLEESISAFEKGIKLSKQCNDYLNTAKQKIAFLTETKDEETEND